MKKYFVRSCIVFLLIATVINPGYSQEAPATETEGALEQRYTEYITSALRLQVRADSLTRVAKVERRNLAFSGNEPERERLGFHIMSVERESFRVQRQADSLYSLAREIEGRLMSGGRHQPAGGSSSAGRLSATPTFLVLDGQNISSGLSSEELLYAMELEKENERANNLMHEVSGINDEIERLGKILDTNPRRRERRRINREIEDLRSRSFDKKMEAMQIYRKVNSLKYTAAINFLDEKRKQAADSLVLRSALHHEELAREGFMQAAGLRETAVDLRSDKYLEGFILRAYTEELRAFAELARALEIYQTPPAPVLGRMRELPLQAGGRVDAGTALSRSRLAATATPVAGNDADIQNAPFIDFGFSVLPVSPYSTVNPLPSGFRLPEGIVYSIQLGIFRTILTPDTFGGLYPVMSSREPDNQSIRYLTGVFRSLAEAEQALIEVNRQGFADAFIIAFNSGSRMPVNRARQILQAQNHSANRTVPSSQSNQGSAQPTQGSGQSNQGPTQPTQRSGQSNQGSVTQSNPGSDQSNPGTVTPSPPSDNRFATPSQSHDIPGVDRVIFKLQLGVFREIVQTAVYRTWQNAAGNKNVDHVRNNNGMYVYSIGNFNTFEEASLMLNNLRVQGISDAFIVPYKGDLRISMDEAARLLRQQ